MKTSLTSSLDDENKKLFLEEFKGSPFLRKHLISILSKKIDSYYAEMRNKDAYSNPNWALAQADSIGYVRAMKELISLLES